MSSNNLLLVGSGIGGGGFLLVYLAQKLYNHFNSSSPSSITTTTTANSEENNSLYNLSYLMNEIFPFHFLPDNSNSGSTVFVEMKLNDKKKLNQLISLLRDYNTCKQAIFKEMLFHKLARIIKPDTTLEDVNSKEFFKREKQIHTCLWILLHCLVLVGNDSIDVLLSIFRLDDFYQFFMEKDFTKHQAMKIFNLKGDSVFNASESFLFSIDIIWLAYAILGHLYCQSLNSEEKNNLQYSKKHLEVLQINKEMFEQLLYLSPSGVNNSKQEGERYKRNILFTSDNQIGYDNLVKFLNTTNLLMRCDDNTLVQLSLSIFGQLVANVQDENVILKNFNVSLSL
ncbi:predicted protein [Naegleria gruberi]|uniref:Predicted protein n=1 Tax=Naegleria gruberi TaxID=5762 RepID=D2UZJ9_NAEGR|nr:uncharacterized protein NAEGRDRAFT_61965 [Naegleria gruberi]EFC49955.1 predicted protein [Naegleria gruberi]|eukprot:XP_002682699.1 predicted protein [Naegleria gruberi strain NEG-M]